MAQFLNLVRDSKGATAIEYGLIAALIAVAAIAALQSVGTKLGTTFNNVSNQLYAQSIGTNKSDGVERRRRFRSCFGRGEHCCRRCVPVSQSGG